jgi:hypothetical protein
MPAAIDGQGDRQPQLFSGDQRRAVGKQPHLEHRLAAKILCNALTGRTDYQQRQ